MGGEAFKLRRRRAADGKPWPLPWGEAAASGGRRAGVVLHAVRCRRGAEPVQPGLPCRWEEAAQAMVFALAGILGVDESEQVCLHVFPAASAEPGDEGVA